MAGIERTRHVRIVECVAGRMHHEGKTGRVLLGAHVIYEPGTVIVELDGPIDIVFGTSSAGLCVAVRTETIEEREVEKANPA